MNIIRLTKLNFIMAIVLLPFMLQGQDYLSKEREKEIKTSGKYYWGEGYDANVEDAKIYASKELQNDVIASVLKQSIELDRMIKAIEMNCQFNRLQHLQQARKIKIIAWIAKDSVFITSDPNTATKPAPTVQPIKKPTTISDSQPSLKQPVATDNKILQELAACKDRRQVLQASRKRGLVRDDNPGVFANPAKCIIAVFSTDGALQALFDAGSETDLLSGKTVQNPEQYYNKEQYILWYFQ